MTKAKEGIITAPEKMLEKTQAIADRILRERKKNDDLLLLVTNNARYATARLFSKHLHNLLIAVQGVPELLEVIATSEEAGIFGKRCSKAAQAITKADSQAIQMFSDEFKDGV